MEDSVVVKIADRHGKTPAQILIRYLYDRNIVVIPKSTNPDRIKQNFDVRFPPFWMVNPVFDLGVHIFRSLTSKSVTRRFRS